MKRLSKKDVRYGAVLVSGLIVLVGAAWFMIDRIPAAQKEMATKEVVPVEPTRVVELADGDVYELPAIPVEAKLMFTSYEGLAYGGSIPGPIIKVTQGSRITLVHQNEMSFDTALHSHGLRGANDMDGVTTLHGGSQKPMKPGESFAYELEFPDAGVYWYHPHVAESATQDRGLYGNFWVVPADMDSVQLGPVAMEEFVVLDDVIVDASGAPVFADGDADGYALMGRYGNRYVINGGTRYALDDVVAGSVVRMYLTNVANARPFDVAIEGGAQIKRVGSDNGFFERDELVKSVVVAPSERVIIDVLFPTAGTYDVVNRKGGTGSDVIGTVTVVDGAADPAQAAGFATIATRGDLTQTFDALGAQFANLPQKKLTFDIDMGGAMGGHMAGMAGMPCHSMGGGMIMGDCTPEDRARLLAAEGIHHDDGIEWDDTMRMMNANMDGESAQWFMRDDATGAKNMDIKWRFAKGDVVRLTLYNDPSGAHPMQHPFHLHGQRMMIYSIDGERAVNRAWKDTVLVPAGKTVEVIAVMDNPGTWMTHCHISEHMEAGMMMNVVVEE